MTYREKNLQIRPINEADCTLFPKLFAEQGWTKPSELFEKYLQEQTEKTRYVRVAEVNGVPCGYVTLVPLAAEGPFRAVLPEVVDFNVLEAYQEHGIGSALFDEVETLAVTALAADKLSLGVGLHAGYGPAQRMYVKRGFIPDGSGVWYQNQPAIPYSECCNDDELVLYMVKELRSANTKNQFLDTLSQ